MKLKKLLQNISLDSVKGSKNIEITGLCSHSKTVVPGNLFIAKTEDPHEGESYVREAIQTGAVAVLTRFYDPFRKEITQIITSEVEKIEAELAARFYQKSYRDLFACAITGTNGKTTISYLVKHLLESVYGKVGLVGTIEYCIGEQKYRATLTTPDLLTNYKLLKEMVVQKCGAAVFEVSSHALVQKRVQGIEYDRLIFTNLTQDHLDYHSDMEEYATAKRELFRKHSKKDAVVIVNGDSSWTPFMLEGCEKKVLSYGVESQADIRAEQIQLAQTGSQFNVTYQEESQQFDVPLVGEFNISNLLAAIAVGCSINLSLKQMATLFTHLPRVKGRLDPVPNQLGLSIFVDFAHTPDALEHTLKSVRQFCKGKLICVFGCGGNRDQKKRPLMGGVVSDEADITIVTSDNPRSEDPNKICKEIVQGINLNCEYVVEVDRRKAIANAISCAEEEDVIVIAGKGHETTQIFTHQTEEFDDLEIAKKLCELEASKRVIR